MPIYDIVFLGYIYLKWKDYQMNDEFKIKSVFCPLMIGLTVAMLVPTQAEAFSTAGIRDWLKNNRVLCLAALAAPIFGLYARKTLQSILKPRQRTNDTKTEALDYFDKFAEAFTKTTTLIGKIFKVAKVIAAADDKWFDAAASL